MERLIVTRGSHEFIVTKVQNIWKSQKRDDMVTLGHPAVTISFANDQGTLSNLGVRLLRNAVYMHNMGTYYMLFINTHKIVYILNGNEIPVAQVG